MMAKRTLLLAAVAGLLGSPAFAACPAIPDGPASYNVQNGMALALCQQAELAAEIERMRQQEQVRALMQDLAEQQIQVRQPPPLILPPAL